MTWFKIDDRFASHPKLERLREVVGDDHGAFAYAVATWTLMGVDCASRLTDGVFTLDRARRVVMLPQDAVERAIEALVSVGYFEAVGANQWAFHDWLEYQPTRDEVEARRADVSRKRSEAGKKGNEVRWGNRRDADAQSDDSKRAATVNGARNTTPPTLLRAASQGAIATSQKGRPGPSRPVPIPNLSNTAEETPTVSLRSAVAIAHAPTQNDPTRVVPVVPPTAHTGGESRAVTLRLVPDAATPPVAPQRPTHTSMNPHHGASMQPSLFADPSQPTTAHATPSEATDAPEPAPTPRSARKATPSGEKAPKVKAPPKEKKVRGPHPSVTLACVQVLADAAGDRFAMGSKWSDGVWRNLARCALKFPDVAEWKLIGEMLSAHGDGHYDMIAVNRVTDGWFTGCLAIAEKWVANGRQSRKSGPFVAKTNATTIPEGHRSYAPSAAQKLANATGKAVSRGMPATFDDHDYDLSQYPDCPAVLAR